MVVSRVLRSRLDASDAICAFFVARASVEFTVADLAGASGLSERTFYRYFPTKQDAVRPVLDWGAGVLATAIGTRTDLSLADAVVQGFEEATGGSLAARTRGLFPLLFRDAGLRAILLQAFHDGEAMIRPALGDRLGVEPGSMDVRIAAATVYAMIRVALEAMIRAGSDPADTLRAALQESGVRALEDRLSL